SEVRGNETIVGDVETPRTDSATKSGSVMGTWGYMSPEQASGELSRVGPASDIFSLGATLYQILTNRPVYSGAQMPGDVVEGKIVPPSKVAPGVPRALEAVCLKAMAREPSARYGDARDLAADVERFLADEPVSAYRDPLVVRARRWAKRHRTP